MCCDRRRRRRIERACMASDAAAAAATCYMLGRQGRLCVWTRCCCVSVSVCVCMALKPSGPPKVYFTRAHVRFLRLRPHVCVLRIV